MIVVHHVKEELEYWAITLNTIIFIHLYLTGDNKQIDRHKSPNIESKDTICKYVWIGVNLTCNSYDIYIHIGGGIPKMKYIAHFVSCDYYYIFCLIILA